MWRVIVAPESTQYHTMFCMAPLDDGSACRRDLTTRSTHKRQASMPPAGFEPSVSASEGPQTHTLDRAASGIVVNSRVSWLIRPVYQRRFFPQNLQIIIDKTPLGRFRYSNLGGPCFLLSFNFYFWACNKTLAVEMGLF
jgi:hypothetical protein